MKKFYLKFFSFVIILTLIFGVFTEVFAAAYRIIKINNISTYVVQGKKYVFPTTVKALMSDGNIVTKKVKWERVTISTAKVMSYKIYGKVIGYTPKIKITIKVLPKAPTGIAAKRAYTGWIKISWKAVSGAAGYNLYYSNDQESWEKWDSVLKKTSAMMSGVDNGIQLYFKVTSIVNGIESQRSSPAEFTMISNSLPYYPNFPAHPDFSYDREGGSFRDAEGVYYYKYSTSRVGLDFPQTYFKRALERDDFIFDSPKQGDKSIGQSTNNKYGDYTAETTNFYFHSADETYIIRHMVIVGKLASDDYFLVLKVK